MNIDKETDRQKQVRGFKDEARERLSELQEALLDLESSPHDGGLINKAFRAMHTIKGNGSMFGYENISKFTHNLESVYHFVRDGKIPVTSQLIALTLSAHDQLEKMLDEETDENPADQARRVEISESFLALMSTVDAVGFDSTEISDVADDATQKTGGVLVSYRIRFKPAKGIFHQGTNPLLILDELRELGECQIFAKLDDVPPLEQIDAELCYSGWDIVLTTDRPRDAIDDVFIFLDSESEVAVDVIGTATDGIDDEPVKRIGEILVDRGDIQEEQLEEMLTDSSSPIGQRLTEAGLTNRVQVEAALAEQKAMRRLKDQVSRHSTTSSIRVDAEKLDRLVDLVGELVTGQARLSQIASQFNEPDLMSVSEEIERLTAELRDNTMSARLVTFEASFKRFKRLVRDLAVETGTDVQLITRGAETELDKTVIERLADPIVHILRNSVDHGIESPEERNKNGKPARGTIQLTASYNGDQVMLTVCDDGAGIDAAYIQRQAIQQGLVTADSQLTLKDTLALIFEPGFTTADSVTSVSGRGVGMDIVKRSVESLRGHLEMNSQPGRGTEVKIFLPLTLAIIDGLHVIVGNDSFIIPLSFVEECVELTQEHVSRFHGRHLVDIRNQIVPYIRVKDQFDIGGAPKDIEQVVVTLIEDRRVGFVVDKVIGQHQTVIKQLSRIYQNVDTISGATIMADGNIALILDVKNLAGLVESTDQPPP